MTEQQCARHTRSLEDAQDDHAIILAEREATLSLLECQLHTAVRVKATDCKVDEILRIVKEEAAYKKGQKEGQSLGIRIGIALALLGGGGTAGAALCKLFGA